MKTLHTLVFLCLIIKGALAQMPIESQRNEKGRYGFMQDTTWVIPPIYDKAMSFANFPLAGVMLKGKWGLIDISGKTIVPFQYDDFLNYEDSIAGIRKGKKFGIISMNTGKELVPVRYDQLIDYDQGWFSWSSRRQAVVVRRDGKEGVINQLGKEIIPCIYDLKSIQEEDSIHLSAKVNKKSGILDRYGKVIVPCQFDQVEIDGNMINTILFANGRNSEITNLHGLYDLNGRMLAPCIYTGYILFDQDNLAVVTLKTKEGMRYGLMDRDGQLVVPATIKDEEVLMKEREKLNAKQ